LSADYLNTGQYGGAGVVLLAAVCGAVCAICYRPYVQRNPTLRQRGDDFTGVFAIVAALTG